jgi:cyclic-di-GMP phosphodiesterase TipF (flagellum assembly factor)
MSNLKDGLITIACAAAGAGTALAMMAVGETPALAGILGIAVFVVGSNLQDVFIRAADRAAHRKELLALKRADLILSDLLAQGAEKHQSEIERVEAGFSEGENRLGSEVKMFETLMRQFAESMVKRIQAVETSQAEIVTQSRRLEQRLSQIRAPVASAVPVAVSPSAPKAEMLDIIQRALIDNRVDLHVQPIVSLPQRKLKYYEALTRLRTADGRTIMPAQYLAVAEEAGLMSTVDNLLLFRSVQFIRRLTARQRDVGVFCNVSMASLTDAGFFPQFVDFMRAHRDLVDQIVFELPQSAYDQMGAAEEASLIELARLGFAFSMDRVTSLEFDMDAMRRRGVRFVKVSPQILLAPDARAVGGIAIEDLRPLLARNGIALIGEKIETERHVVDLLDFEIDYGQGFLFGEPRPMKDDVTEAPVRTEAPAPPQPQGMTALFQAREQRRAAG